VGAVGDIELDEDALQVRLYGLLRGLELQTDCFVGVAAPSICCWSSPARGAVVGKMQVMEQVWP
jgi:hypothetical protein